MRALNISTSAAPTEGASDVKTQVPWLVAFVLIFGLVVYSGRAQGPGTLVGTTSPPIARSIVNLAGKETIPFGGSKTVYTVPTDRWLVISDCRLTWFLDVRQELGGAATLKRPSDFSYVAGTAAIGGT